MSTNEFDRLVAEKMSQAAFEYNAGDWENLTAQLAAARRKKRAIIFISLSSGLAAAVAILLVGIAPMLSKKATSAIQYTAASKAPKSFSSHSSSSVYNNATAQQTAIQQTTRNNHQVSSSYNKQPTPAPEVAANTSNNQPVNTSMPAAEKQIVDTPAFKKKLYGYDQQPFLYAKTEDRHDRRKINLSVAGGVNYGMANTGYAFGAVADKKISNRFGIEVAVAYVGNTGSVSGQYPSTNTGGVFSPPKPSAVVYLPLNYIQFAPMADYNLFPKITLSAGPDFQRLLQEHSITLTDNNNTTVAPLIDFGILLRTEYAISTHLKAGLSYHLGANNLVSSGNNYIERNYMQVQLRYKLY